jgi:disulfide bond formation protein DsbB
MLMKPMDFASPAPVPSPSGAGTASSLAWVTLGVALVAAAGGLALSLALGLKPCALCFYQRSFALALVAVLAVGLVTRGVRTEVLTLLALPLAGAGLGVAAFHVSLELRGKLECPAGFFGLGTAPQQSLAIFAIASVLLLVDVLRGLRAGAVGPTGLLLALVLTGAMVWAACVSNPPAAVLYDYDKPPDICRPPAPARTT